MDAPPLDAIASAYRQAACGRVVAMLASKNDAPEEVVRKLASAIEPPIVTKPVLRADVCLVMILVGALVVLVWNHVRECRVESDSAGEAEDEAQARGDGQGGESALLLPRAE